MKWVWHGCDLYVLHSQLPGQNENELLSLMGFCPGTWISNGVLPGHMDGVLPGHMDGVLPGHLDGVLPKHLNGHLDGCLAQHGEDAPSMCGQNLSKLVSLGTIP